MQSKRTSHESIRRILTSGFSVRDVAEPLLSFDDSVAIGLASERMSANDFDVAGVRVDGLVAGFVRNAPDQSGCLADFVEPFDSSPVVADTESLASVVPQLSTSPQVFVSMLGTIGGIVTRGDLEKPAARMWLFGMVTIIELRFVRLIELYCPDDSWQQYLSESRLEKAKSLQEERRRRGQYVQLIDCIQLGDKGTVMIRNEAMRKGLQFQSRRQAEDAFKRLDRLRNLLAHAQDYVDTEWDTIVLLCENLERVISGPPGHAELLEGA